MHVLYIVEMNEDTQMLLYDPDCSRLIFFEVDTKKRIRYLPTTSGKPRAEPESPAAGIRDAPSLGALEAPEARHPRKLDGSGPQGQHLLPFSTGSPR